MGFLYRKLRKPVVSVIPVAFAVKPTNPPIVELTRGEVLNLLCHLKEKAWNTQEIHMDLIALFPLVDVATDPTRDRPFRVGGHDLSLGEAKRLVGLLGVKPVATLPTHSELAAKDACEADYPTRAIWEPYVKKPATITKWVAVAGPAIPEPPAPPAQPEGSAQEAEEIEIVSIYSAPEAIPVIEKLHEEPEASKPEEPCPEGACSPWPPAPTACRTWVTASTPKPEVHHYKPGSYWRKI